MSFVSIVVLLAASIWQVYAAEIGAFTYPAPTSGPIDFSKLPVFCIDQHIDIQWTAATSEKLGMIMWQAGKNKYDSNFGFFANTGDYSWYVDTGLDTTAAPFFFSMYIAGGTSVQFSSGMFNISSSCSSTGTGGGSSGSGSGTGSGSGSGAGSGGSGSSSSSTSSSTTSSSTSSTSTSSSTTHSTTTTRRTTTSSVSQTSRNLVATPVTGGSRATVINPGPIVNNNNEANSAEASLQAVVAGILGSWLFAVL